MNESSGGSDDNDHLEGRYANSFQVGHNAFEFVLEFGQATQRDNTAHYHSRIITAPVYAKAFLATMEESINRYEAAFGTIPDLPGGKG